MICVYEISVVARCPVDDQADRYDVTLVSKGHVLVEILKEFCSGYAERKVFQEDLTAEIAREFMCAVVSVGHHSGVKTTVFAP